MLRHNDPNKEHDFEITTNKFQNGVAFDADNDIMGTIFVHQMTLQASYDLHVDVQFSDDSIGRGIYRNFTMDDTTTEWEISFSS